MPRIPDSVLDRLKRQVSLIEVMQASGVKLTRRGQEWLGLCPLHSDKETPSLSVNPEKGSWHCFGCDRGGSVIDWRMETEKISFRPAAESLLRDYLPDAFAELEGELVLDVSMDDRQIWDATVGYYRDVLLASEAPLAYLDRRGLVDPELLEHFELGYSDRTLGHHIPPRQTKPGQRFRKRLMELGIMREKTGQEHMTGRVVVPVRDESGLVVEMYGRAIYPNLDPKVTPKHLHMPGPRRGVLNWRCLLEHKEVILCESPLDAMTFWASGFRNVISAWGAGGFSAEHLEALQRYGAKRVLIAYDRDEAGDQGAAKVGETLLAVGIECFRVLFPRGMDANAYAMKVQPAEKSLSLAIRQARWMGKGSPPSRSSVQVEAKAEEAAEAEKEAARKEPAPEAQTLGELEIRAEAKKELASSLAASAASGPRSPAASPVPEAPRFEVPCEVRPEEVVIVLGDRRWRVRGLTRNLSYAVLKVNLMVSVGDSFFVDTFDLYSARHRANFLHQAAKDLDRAEEVVRSDLKRVLFKLEELQRAQIEARLEPKEERPEMTAAEREEALDLLRSPQLMDRLLEDFRRCGVVGEETNKLIGYLAAASRLLEQPLAVIIQSSSSAGKTSLMNAVLAFVPEEERVEYSAMTGQSLFYMSEQSLEHKVLALVEEEGVQRAAYALKLLLSEGRLRIASTGKDPKTGRLVTQEYEVEGPVAAFLTTTAVELDEELQNRCLVLAVDENREQTRAIHRQQRSRRTLEGFLERRKRQEILTVHRNAQRLLRRVHVINPFAEELTFTDVQTRARRDNEKYLTLIEAIALLGQYQRPIRKVEQASGPVEYVEVEARDIELANRLAGEVLGASLDELAPQTRRFLARLERSVTEICKERAMDREDVRFTLREARDWVGFGQTQSKVHMARLVDLEYVLVHRGGRGQSFVYELLYDGSHVDGGRFLPYLIEASSLEKRNGQRQRSAQKARRSGPSRPRIGPESGGGRGAEKGANGKTSGGLRALDGESTEKALLGTQKRPADHRPSPEALAVPSPT